MSKAGNLAALAPIFTSTESLSLYYAEDPPYLPRILVFYWPIAALGSMTSTSRIRTTVLTAAGFVSFQPFQLSPSSAYYTAVHKLPEDKQRDNVSRGIAFSMLKYFAQLSPAVKNAMTEENLGHTSGSKLFGQLHAAEITCRLGRVVNVEEVIGALRAFSKDHSSMLSSAVIPQASIRRTRPSVLAPDSTNEPITKFAPSLPATESPTPRIRRTPSYSANRSRIGPQAFEQRSKPTVEQKQSLRFKMCEFVDTEERYVSKLHELTQLVTEGAYTKSYSTTAKSVRTASIMLRFPSLLDQIVEVNTEFLDEITHVLEKTDDTALASIAEDNSPSGIATSQPQDRLGAQAFARVLLSHFPKFLIPYREYLDIQPKFSANIHQFIDSSEPSNLQRARSVLMEPIQRVSRYSLFIDAMSALLPSSSPSPTTKTLAKARGIIVDICAMEPSADTILGSLRIEHEDTKERRALSPTKLLQNLRPNGMIKEAAPTTLRDPPRTLMPTVMRSFSKKSRGGLGSVGSKQHLAERAVNRQDGPVAALRPMTADKARMAALVSLVML